MFTVTDSATAHLSKMLDEADVPEGISARFVISEDGLGLEPDSPKPGDETFEHEGRTVLLLDAEVAEVLSERTLDVGETDEGVGLTLH